MAITAVFFVENMRPVFVLGVHGTQAVEETRVPSQEPTPQVLSHLFFQHSCGHLLVITGYKWDYTFYKWGYVGTYNWYFGP